MAAKMTGTTARRANRAIAFSTKRGPGLRAKPTAADCSATLCQLIDQRCGNLPRRGCHHESIERRGLRTISDNTTLISARASGNRSPEGQKHSLHLGAYNVLNKAFGMAAGTGIFRITA